jgi:hypothetical protein
MLVTAFQDTRRDRRKGLRSKFGYPARMLFGGVWSATCVVVDISESGAKLKVLATQTIAEEFSLLIGGHSEVKRRCRVVWRSGSTIGVQFLRK